MNVILDTCVISEIQRPQGNARVREQVDQLADKDLYLSVITIGEIAKGITLLKAGKRKQDLEQWLLSVVQHYGNRILPIDVETTHIWGKITADAQQAGDTLPASDGLIAATAIRHGMHIMTRNTEHFHAAGAFVINPWERK